MWLRRPEKEWSDLHPEIQNLQEESEQFNKERLQQGTKNRREIS